MTFDIAPPDVLEEFIVVVLVIDIAVSRPAQATRYLA